MSEIWTRKVGAAVIAALVILSAISGAAIVFTGAAHAQEWPAVYDPFQILTLNLELNPVDWQTVLNDETYDIEVPVWFWTGSEEPIYVSVRRKSGDPISTGGGAPKVSLKIDINEYIEGQKWRSLTKLSLENGDDSDIVREGLAWNVHRLASCEEGYGYEAGFASWMRVKSPDPSASTRYSDGVSPKKSVSPRFSGSDPYWGVSSSSSSLAA